MRRSTPALAVASVFLVGLVPGVRAASRSTTPHLPAHSPRLVVTGAHLSPVDYLRRGLTLRQAEVLAKLDRLAEQPFVDRRVLQAALDASGGDTTIEASSSDSGPQTQLVLSPVGDLDGRGGPDVLESRYVTERGSTTSLFVARDGATGASLWSKTFTSQKGVFVVPVPAHVGAGGRSGVVFEQISVFTSTDVLEAVSGTGRVLWTNTLSVQSLPPDDGGPAGYSGSETFLTTLFDERVTHGGLDAVVLVQRAVYTDNGARWSVHGDAQVLAVSQTTGKVRALTARVSSPDGYVTADVGDDQNRDGLLDLTIVSAGSSPRTEVLRGYDGATIWARTDLAAPFFGDLMPSRDLSPTPGPAALLFVSAADPGKLHSDGVGVPFFFYVPVADPTRSTHGVVAMLAVGTGHTLWTRAGDMPYVLRPELVPAVGVVSDDSSVSATTATASIRIDVVGPVGTLLWTRTYSLSAPASATDGSDTAFGWAYPLLDLDGDGGAEGTVYLEADTSSFNTAVRLIRSRDGAPVADQTSNLLGGGVTRVGTDRFKTTVGHAGVELTVLRGRDGGVAFARLLPGTRGITDASVQAAGASCADVLYVGTGGGQAALGVLASNGAPLWWVSGLAPSLQPEKAVRALRVPRVRC